MMLPDWLPASRDAFAPEAEPFEARPIAWRLVWSLVAIEIAAICAFVWMVM